MRLVVDASALVAQALRAAGRLLLTDPRLDLLIAAEVSGEAQHEIRRRAALVAARLGLIGQDAAEFLRSALQAADRPTLWQPSGYSAYLAEAVRRVPRDPTDAPTVALALASDAAIWTTDLDFFGCGVPVWTTETLRLHLR